MKESDSSTNTQYETSLDEQLAELIPDAQVDPDIKNLMKDIGVHLVKKQKLGLFKTNFEVKEMNSNFLENELTKKAVKILERKGYNAKAIFWC